jgi:hypothetical protein
MESNSVIFLDIDGVMVTSAQLHAKDNPVYHNHTFDKKCVRVLNEILQNTTADIVVSSDWKTNYGLQALNNIFGLNGITREIIAITPSLWGIEYFNYAQLEDCRAAEILKYVKEHNITNYVAVDDLNLSPWIPNFVWCKNYKLGIKELGIKELILDTLN